MNIAEALQQEGSDIRVTNGSRWLVWDDADSCWKVYCQAAYQKRARVLIVTSCEDDAVAVLTEDDKVL